MSLKERTPSERDAYLQGYNAGVRWMASRSESFGVAMTISEAAGSLGVTPATLRQQVANHKLRAEKRGRDWWVTAAEVERYRRENRRAA